MPPPTYQKQDPKSIQSCFSSIAPRYDRVNAILSLQFHRYWNRKLVKLMQKKGTANTLLDLCAGTGDIAFNYILNAKNHPFKQIYLLDFCKEMLEVAQQKAKNHPQLQHQPFEWTHGDAQKIPLKNHSVDQITIAYGIRNVQRPTLCFQESFRVLKPKGHFGILELTRPPNIILNRFHHLYLKYIVPSLGKVITSNSEAYQYLSSSIQKFCSPRQLEAQLKEVGFASVQQKKLLGGIATILIASK